jgi:hypothetical protein
MQHVVPNWQSVCSDASGGNRSGEHCLPGYVANSEGGSRLGGKMLAQTILTMKSPRKQNGNAVGTVRSGIPYTADLDDAPDALPRFHESTMSEAPSPREINLSEEDSFRAFLSSRLPKHKASQALRERIRSSVAHSSSGSSSEK